MIRKPYPNQKKSRGETQLEQKKGLEFGYDDYKLIDEYCRKKSILWFASAWDINILEFLYN
jgi:N-acetylneuraminate synthase